MVWRRLTRVAAAAAMVTLGACFDTDERNIITERTPFFHGTVLYNQAETGRVISSARRFADAKGMDFLLSQDEPDKGDYNAHVAGRDLNFQVIHIQAVSPATTDIYAVSRSTPTETDKAMVQQFVCVVRGQCQS